MLLLFNRLGSNTEVLNSVIAPNGTITGTITYNALKYGNGSYSNNNANNIIFNPITGFDPNKWSAEMWLDTDYNMVDGVSNAYYGIIYWYYDANNYIIITLYPASYYNYCAFKIAGSTTNYSLRGLTWTAHDKIHVAWTYNKDGIGGGADKLQVYVNGVKVGSSTTAAATGSVTGGEIGILTDPSFFGNEQADACIDNLKVHNYDKTDFSDRLNERGGLADQVICG